MPHKIQRTQPAERTRNRVLSLLKEDGPSDSISLAKRLRLSAMAVRQHLYSLLSEKVVAYTNESRRIGRPVKLWELTPAADRFFPDGHSELAINLIKAIRRSMGDMGFQRVLRSRGRRRRQILSKNIPLRASLEDRIAILAQERRKDGYLAGVQIEKNGTYLLIENHCPIHAAAAACNALCDAELKLLKSVLGAHTDVERLEHILTGSRRCVYRISSC